MTLDEWLREKGLTDAEFAGMAGVSREAARLWRHGKRMPGAPPAAPAGEGDQVATILRLTDGRVTEADLAAAHEAWRRRETVRNG